MVVDDLREHRKKKDKKQCGQRPRPRGGAMSLWFGSGSDLGLGLDKIENRTECCMDHGLDAGQKTEQKQKSES